MRPKGLTIAKMVAKVSVVTDTAAGGERDATGIDSSYQMLWPAVTSLAHRYPRAPRACAPYSLPIPAFMN